MMARRAHARAHTFSVIAVERPGRCAHAVDDGGLQVGYAALDVEDLGGGRGGGGGGGKAAGFKARFAWNRGEKRGVGGLKSRDSHRITARRDSGRSALGGGLDAPG